MATTFGALGAGGIEEAGAEALAASRTARIAGFLYLLAGIGAPFAYIIAPAKLMVRGDAAATLARVVAAPSYLRLGVAAELISSVLLICAAAALHHLLERVNRAQARLMLIFASLAAPIVFADAVDQLAALDVAGANGGAGAAQLALLFMTLHRHGIVLAQVFWGLWLLPLGLLFIGSKFLPRAIGVLLLAGGSAYVVASMAALFVPTFAPIVSQVAAVAGGIAEASAIIWLIGWGTKEVRATALSSKS
jgi:hypothetical protein